MASSSSTSQPMPSTAVTGDQIPGVSTISHCPRILSLDGGGVRGLSSLLILREIMEEIQRRTGARDTPRPCEYFDLIGGTSTGGLIAIMLGRLRMSVEDCIDKYIKLSEQVFKRDQVLTGVIPTGDDRCRFDAGILESVIQNLVKDKLKDVNAIMAENVEEGRKACPTFVVATSASNADGPAVIFRSYDCVGHSANKCKIWQAARCTSAAPSFFKPMFVEIPSPGGWYLDGGLRNNNPSQLAQYEAHLIWPTVKRFCAVSIGTGRQRNVEFVDIKDLDIPKATNSKGAMRSILSRIPGRNTLDSVKNTPRGVIELAKIAKATVAMSTSAEPIHQTLLKSANSTDPERRFPYHRFNVDRGMETIGLEEWKARVRIAELTQRYMREEEGETKRNACAHDLLKPPPVEHIKVITGNQPQYFVVPQWCQRNPHFTGRSVLLKKLRKMLHDEKPNTYQHRVALFGMGGVGKTQIAIEYVFEQRREYSSIFWLSAEDDAGMLQGFQNIASVTKCTDPNAQDKTSVAKEVLKWLSQQDGWLLVFDNVDDITVVHGYLPEITKGGHTVITTRNPYTRGLPAEGLEISIHDKEEAVQLLLVRANIVDNEEIHQETLTIVNELGCLALAIEQAAAYIREYLKDIFKFMAVYSSHRMDIHEIRPSGNWDYPKTVATTWLLSFEIVKKTDPRATQLLNLFAFLNADEILVEFLEAGSACLPEVLESLIRNKFAFPKILGLLAQYSLIQRPGNGDIISIHRLVQAIVKDSLVNDEERHIMDMVVALFLSAFPEFHKDTRQTCRRYQSQVVGPLVSLKGFVTDDMVEILNRVGLFLQIDGKYFDCERVMSMAVEICSALFGDDDHRTLMAMNNLACVYHNLGQINEAAVLNEKVLEARRRILGNDECPKTLSSMSSLAWMYQTLGRTNEAAALLEKVLEAQQRILGDEHPDTLLSMNILAWIYHTLGQTNEAIALNEKTLEARRRILGNDECPKTLSSMSNLAWMYHTLGRTNEAAALLEKVLEAQQRILGGEHPDTLLSMNTLAWIYHTLGRTNEAAAMQEKVLEAQQRTLGHEHPDTLLSMNNLAWIYHTLGQINEGAALHEKVLEARQRILGDEHPDTITSINNLAQMYYSFDRINEAAALDEKALEASRKILGDAHPVTSSRMWNLASVYWNLGKRSEAITLFEMELNQCRVRLGEQHSETLASMKNLGSRYRAVGRLESAILLESPLEEVRD